MAEKKEFVGIVENECNFQGKVIEDPTFFEVSGGEGCILKVQTFVPEEQPNGQWVGVEHIVPVIVMNPTKTANNVKPWVKAGKEIKVRAYYKTWEDASGPQHGLIMTYIRLGHGPFRDKNAPPPLPAE